MDDYFLPGLLSGKNFNGEPAVKSVLKNELNNIKFHKKCLKVLNFYDPNPSIY